MRPSSNLKSNQQFKLTKAQKSNTFISLWNSRSGAKNIYEFAASMALNILYPFTKGKLGGIPAKDMKKFCALQVASNTYRGKSVLRRDSANKDLHFRSVIYHTPKYNGVRPVSECETILIQSLGNAPLREKLDMINSVIGVEKTPFGQTPIIPCAEVIKFVETSMRTKEILKNCLVSLEADTSGNDFVIWANWIIHQKEAEYLNNAPFLEIKLSNFYPSLSEWGSTIYGEIGQVPVTVSSVIAVTSDVKKTLQGSNIKPRVGIDDMIVDINLRYYTLPEEDRASEYEQRLMDFGLQEDGSYTWQQKVDLDENGNQVFDMSNPAPKKRMPANIPVFTDWLNDKFVYSNTSGALTVMDLGTTVPVKAYHLQKLINLPLKAVDSDDAGIAMLLTGINAAAQLRTDLLQIRPTSAELGGWDQDMIDRRFRGANSFPDLIKAALVVHSDAFGDLLEFDHIDGDYTPRVYQIDPVNGVASLRFLGRIVKDANALLSNNVDVMYSKLSVITTRQVLAVLNIIAKYSKDRDQIVATDRTEREAYLDQGLDPEYKPEALPNIRKDLKYAPHQFRVQNRMRRGPKFAIWAVAAGGGKTPLAITNTINELDKKRCLKPIILCPSHLISNYVKDIVYFTSGRMNVIPVTNTTFASQGEDALKKLIEHAPKNTIVLADFNFMKNRTDTVAYGTKSIKVFKNAEFMRQFEFDMVIIDECHFLKNVKSARRGAVARFMQDVPMKRLASGTFVADTPKDVVSQVALLDPTIFGSVANFIKDYAAEAKGEKILAYKPGGIKAMKDLINEHCVYASAKRKEWAALLPTKHERFIGVELSDNQRILYESILEETVKLIEEAMAKKPKLKDMLESKDDTVAEQLESMLKPYMARLERFLSAPDADPAAKVFLKDAEDNVSPKAKEIYKICQEHLDKKIIGKVLIFTQYKASAEAVYDNAPGHIKQMMIHYTAGNKIEGRTAFEREDNMMFMVGVSSSMDTGLNFQHVSRLIRMETVWTPGTLEQGNSRINRPQMKSEELRTDIYFDWLVVNRSVDITKVSRLVAKIIDAAKFDEADNSDYAGLEDLPPTPITLDSIKANNDFNEHLSVYLEEFQRYQSIVKDDYAQYLIDNPNSVEAVPCPTKGLLPDSKLISRVPYVPEMEIYNASELGLIRYDEFVRQDMESTDIDAGDDADDSDEDGDDSEDEDDDSMDDVPQEDVDNDTTDPKELVRLALREAVRKERLLIKHRAVHTEFGDGVCTGIGKKKIRVRLSNGDIVIVPKMSVFVITRSTTNGIDMRNELLKQVGEIPIDTPIVVPVEKSPQDKKRKGNKGPVEEVLPEQGLSGEFDFTVMNDHLAIMYRGDSTDSTLVNALQNFGFRISPQYWFARVKYHQALLRLFRMWRDKGFTIEKDTSSMFKHIYETMKSNKAGLNAFGFSTKLAIRNFYREEVKPSADPTIIKIYPVIQDGNLYLMLPKKGQAGNAKAKRLISRNINWLEGGGEDEVIRFVTSKPDAISVLKQLQDAGIIISNLDELKDQFKKLKLVNRRD
jgi:superfamily II DNA or RNA helicase